MSVAAPVRNPDALDSGGAFAVAPAAGGFSRGVARRVEWSLSSTALVALIFAAGLVALQLWAVNTEYPLRVTSDTPTYLALLPMMAAHPFAHESVFLSIPGIQTPDATPYMLGLAKLWQAIAPPGQLHNPIAEGRFLGLIGIPVSLAMLAMIALFAVKVAGRRQGLLAVAVLMVLFGPAHVIWANDLSFNALLYGGFFPQNVGITLALATLLALRGRGPFTLALACALAGATMVVHPLTGLIMAGLAAFDGCVKALRGEDGVYRCSCALTVGFVAGTLWPDYQLNVAMSLSSVPGAVLIAACAVAPNGAALLGALLRRYPIAITPPARLSAIARRGRVSLGLAVAGAAIVGALALWEVIALHIPPTDPLIHSSRLSVYWVEQRWRWFPMLAAGTVGLWGLVTLVRRRQPLPACWFGGCLGIALLGQLGLPVPVWWRFLLFAQIPLAIGTAVFLVEEPRRLARQVATATLLFSLVFKLLTLVDTPDTFTYFGSPLQEAYTIGRYLPSRPAGLIASDPFTSYYLPAATGRHVLTMTKAHVTVQSELNASNIGYELLHHFYSGSPTGWFRYGQAMWKAGVRFVLVEKHTSLAAPNLVTFSTGPTPLVRTAAEWQTLGRYYWRLTRVGTLLHTDEVYALYRLDARRLFPDRYRAKQLSTHHGHRRP